MNRTKSKDQTKSKDRTGKWEMFATAPPGLESLVAEELRGLPVAQIDPQPGGVSFRGDLHTLARANLRLRIPGRIMVRIAQFRATHLSELEKMARSLDFHPFIPVNSDRPIRVTATCRKSKIYHSKAAAQRVALGIQSSMQRDEIPTFADGSPLRSGTAIGFQVNLENDRCTISVDSTGAHLHMRGYKTVTTHAPLRENLAAAALAFCRWTGEEPLLDPLCGSGTIPIEGALIAARTAPGVHRDFAFQHWPIFHQTIFQEEHLRVTNYAIPLQTPIFASDKDPEAILAATTNATGAGFLDGIQISQCPLDRVSLDGAPGLILCNPPYGKRLGNMNTLLRTYKKIGDLARSTPNWKLGLITSNRELATATGVKFNRISDAFPHGGTRIKIYCAD